jgi:DNA-binding transcriptional regulator YhcF (GntR family)
MELAVDPTSAVPLFEQVRGQIALAIENGDLAPADRLPTVRSMAADLGLATNTVARSYRELELQGLVRTGGRHGTFVAGEPSVVRQQATVEARRFALRMRQLGIGEPEMFAILRGEAAGLDAVRPAGQPERPDPSEAPGGDATPS